MLKYMTKAAMLTACILAPAAAYAASGAIVTANLSFRSGPSTSYHQFATIPDGSRVNVLSCASARDWCNIEWSGSRGWVSSHYLAFREERTYSTPKPVYRAPQPGFGVTIGIGRDRDDYRYGKYYRHNRGRDDHDYRYGDHDRHKDRHDDRADRREERRDVKEARKDVKAARKDFRQAKRNDENAKDELKDLYKAKRRLLKEKGDLD